MFPKTFYCMYLIMSIRESLKNSSYNTQNTKRNLKRKIIHIKCLFARHS